MPHGDTNTLSTAHQVGALAPRLSLERYVSAVVDHRWWVIAIVTALTVLLGSFAARQQVIINPAAVVPQSHPYIQATNTIERIFGSKYLVVIGVTPEHGDALQPHVLQTVRELTSALYASPSVSSNTLLSLASRQAKSISGDAAGFTVAPLLGDALPATPEETAALRHAIDANPVYRDTVLSSDGRTATIMLELKENPDGFGAMLEDVDTILEQAGSEGIQLTVSGNPVFLRQAEVFASRINWLFPIAVLVIGLLHYEAFRTRQGLVLPLVTALLSVIWGVGIMGLLGVPMDIFNSPTPILILAVAAGHAVQLLKRYYEYYIELVNGQGMHPQAANRLATIQSLAAVGPVLVIAGGVAALGFFSLVVFEVETVRAFGIFTGIGILTAVVLEFTFTPAVRASLAPPSAAHIATENKVRAWDRVSAMLARAVTGRRSRTWLLAGLAATVAVAIAGWPNVHVDNSSKGFFSDALPLQRDDALLNQATGGTNVLYIMADTGVQDGIKDPAVVNAIRQVQDAAERHAIVGKTLSIDDFLQRMHQAAEGDPRERVPMPADRDLIAQYLFLYSLSGDPEDFSAHVDYSYQRAKISVMLRTNSNAEIKQLVDDLGVAAQAAFPEGVEVSFGGEVAQTIAVTDVMVRSKLLNIAQILFVIFCVSAVAFRSLLAGALVLTPLLVVLSVTFGVMGYLGIPLNIPNSLISAMAVGIGADYAIYLIYRIREYVQQGQTLTVAVDSAIRTAGKACLFVATAVAGGYAVLLLSYDYKVHMWLSSFIVIAMLVSVFAALTLIPSAILAIEPRFVMKRRSGNRIATLVIVLAAVFFLGYSQLAWSAPADARTVMERNAAVTRFDTSTAEATFVLSSARGGERVRSATLATKLRDGSQDTMRLVRFTGPADIRGTSTLLVENSQADDDMWVYLPAMKRVRRLAASNKKDSFIGTDFSYGDVIGHAVEDWKHTLLADQQRNGAMHYVVESVPATPKVQADSGYGKRITWIHKENYTTSHVEAFDTSGARYKTFDFSQMENLDPARGKWQPMKAVGTNLRSGHVTTITFSGFKIGRELPDRMFSPGSLTSD